MSKKVLSLIIAVIICLVFIGLKLSWRSADKAQNHENHYPAAELKAKRPASILKRAELEVRAKAKMLTLYNRYKEVKNIDKATLIEKANGNAEILGIFGVLKRDLSLIRAALRRDPDNEFLLYLEPVPKSPDLSKISYDKKTI